MSQVEQDITGPEAFALRKWAYFPAAFLLFIAAGFCVPAIEGRPVLIGIVASLVVLAIVLAVLAATSWLRIGAKGLEILFFGRRSSMAWDHVATVTYGMSFPSLAFGLWLAEASGRHVRLNFGYWSDERRLVSLAASRLLEVGPEVDEPTASLLAEVTHTSRRAATARRIPWLERRTGRRASPDQKESLVWPILAFAVLVGLVAFGMARREVELTSAAATLVGGLLVGAVHPWNLNLDRPAWAVVSVLVIAVPPLVLVALTGPAFVGYLIGLMGGQLLIQALRSR